MTTHTTHRVHVNSAISFAAMDLSERDSAILNAYLIAGAMTDRDCARRLGFADMNSVRPFITRLCSPERGLLWECGDVVCEITGRKVRICAPTAKARGPRA